LRTQEDIKFTFFIIVTPTNIEKTFNKYNVPIDLDFLSIDVDNKDKFYSSFVSEEHFEPPRYFLAQRSNGLEEK
jgi:hypothetical protein